MIETSEVLGETSEVFETSEVTLLETSEVFVGALGARASRPHNVGAALAAARTGNTSVPTE